MDRRTFIAALGATSALAFARRASRRGPWPSRPRRQRRCRARRPAGAHVLLLHGERARNSPPARARHRPARRIALEAQRLFRRKPGARPRGLSRLRPRARGDRPRRLVGTSALHLDTVRFLADGVIHGLASFPYGNNSVGYFALCDQPAGRRLSERPGFPRPAASGRQMRADADAYLARLEAFGTALDDE